MPRLPHDDFMALRDALLDAFSSTDSLEDLARAARDKPLAQLALGNNTEDIVETLIRRAEEELWVDALIQSAHQLRKSHLPLEVLARQRRRALWTYHGDPFRVSLLHGHQALINRKKLRKAVQALEEDDGPRILIVDGDRLSGKTYTVQFISYLAQHRRTFTWVWIDLSRLVRTPAQSVGPVLLGEALADQMSLRDLPEQHNEQGSTWAQRFCNWLTGKLENDPTNHWFVFDSFRNIRLEEGARDLIHELVIRSYLNLPRIRLILLSYPDVEKVRSLVPGAVEYEQIEPISSRHVADFLLDIHVERRHAQDRARGLPELRVEELLPELTVPVQDSIRRVLGEVKPHDPRWLETLGRAAANEARRIRQLDLASAAERTSW